MRAMEKLGQGVIEVTPLEKLAKKNIRKVAKIDKLVKGFGKMIGHEFRAIKLSAKWAKTFAKVSIVGDIVSTAYDAFQLGKSI